MTLSLTYVNRTIFIDTYREPHRSTNGHPCIVSINVKLTEPERIGLCRFISVLSHISRLSKFRVGLVFLFALKMGQRKFNLIVAACENLGIGIKGNLPWHLKYEYDCLKWGINEGNLLFFLFFFLPSRNELKFFSTTTTKIVDPSKRNCVIMGRLTYFGIPEKKRPLPNRLNIVLSSNPVSSDYPSSVVVFKSLAEAMQQLSETDLGADIENVWICGGNRVYKEAMASDLCHRIYFTEIKASFECDAFFPEIPSTFTVVPNDPDIPSEIQEENGTKYQYKIYERRQ